MNIREYNGTRQVFDPIRGKWVKLTPEEDVRQQFLEYLTANRHYPAGLIAVEHLVVINNLRQRADIVIYDRLLQPFLIVECKAPSVGITKAVFAQALRYNMKLGVRYLVVTNGIAHYCAEMLPNNEVKFLSEIPEYVPTA